MSRKGKVEDVYNYLLTKLINREYLPNSRLLIGRVAEACGVSETPVREALLQLEREGFVRITPNRGATVVGVTEEKIKEITEIRGILEGYLTRVSVDYLSPNDLRKLRELNEQMRQAAERNDYEQYAVLNRRFHHSIYEHTEREEWIRLIDQLWSKWQYTANVFVIDPARMMESVQEHETLLHLITDRKYDEVEAYARMHKHNALAIWSSYLQ